MRLRALRQIELDTPQRFTVRVCLCARLRGSVLLFLCVCVHWCRVCVCVCVGSSFLRKGTIAAGVNGWMEDKGTKKKHFREFSQFSEMDKHNNMK